MTPPLRAEGSAPPLVALELTYRCPHECEVCFHRLSPITRRQGTMPLELACTVLEQARAAGAVRVRLTGGEPLLHPHVWVVAGRARALGLEVWVNTAGAVRDDDWERLGAAADDVLLPLREAAQRARMVAGLRRVRSAALTKARAVRVRLGVVLTRAHQRELPAFVALADQEACLLEAYRVMTVPGVVAGNDRSELIEVLGELDRLNRGRARHARVRIANAVPYCITDDHALVERNSHGARFDDGRSRLVVGPDGTVRPSYALALKLGVIPQSTLAELWTAPALRSLHSLTALPARCQMCPDVAGCRGGSRHEAWRATGDFAAMDPVADVSHVDTKRR